jgi:fructuronate reductase
MKLAVVSSSRVGQSFSIRAAIVVRSSESMNAAMPRRGQAIDVRDPLSARLRTIANQAGLVADRLAPALLEVREIFGAELAADPRFRGAVTDALSRIIAKGAKMAVADFD